MAVLDKDPGKELLFKSHCKLGMIKCKLYELDSAYEHFQKALLLDFASIEQCANLIIKMGLIEEERGDLNKAIQKYQSVFKLDFDQRIVYSHIAWCYYKAKNYERCKEYLLSIDNSFGFKMDAQA